ncbi:MAG TPA: hypothetical protein VM553_09140 [Dongiaceae bacterium]|nr:hypothetical protein [Dongiaceae bacterium]
MATPEALTILRLLEADVTQRRYTQAHECLQWLLANTSVHSSRPDLVFLSNYDEREVIYVATRIASAICQLFSDPAFGIEDRDFYKYAIGHASLVSILGVSGFGSADHVIENLLEPLEGGKANVVSRQTFNKVLLLHGIHSEVKLPYEQYLKSHPQHIVWMVLLAVGALFCVTHKENVARNDLIARLMNQLDPQAFESPMLGWLCIAWMHCSYATIPERNRFKKILNQMLVHWMGSFGIDQIQVVKPEPRNGKPVLLVVNEYFNSAHAVYRCYAPTIDALREHFYVVGLTEKRKSDANSRKHFDSHYYLEWQDDVVAGIKNLVAQVRKIKPHAIYYTSVGMALPAIIMSNLRLAPCQFMSLGHPASSHSDVMDYCLIENQFVADRSQFSETLFAMEDNASSIVPHLDQPPRKELLNWKKPLQPGEPVRIIITGSAMKINAEFVGVLADIQAKAHREVEYHFIPNLNKLSIAKFRKMLTPTLKRFVVHPSMAYPDYLRMVARCQIHFSPFPFGSTNSLVDSMLLGLPLVVMHVTNSELKIDAGIINKLQIEDLRPANTVTEYIELACRLIDDDQERERLTRLVEEKEVEQIFFGIQPGARERSARRILEMVQQHR